jgi:futalosine hydrolase
MNFNLFKSNIFILLLLTELLFFMSLKILIVFATSSEEEILKKICIPAASDGTYAIGNCIINSLVTGVGGISTAWSFRQWLSMNAPPDLAINAGIAGSFNSEIMTGDVVIPITDCFADMAIESESGITTLFEAGLSDPDLSPFRKGLIYSENIFVEKAAKTLRKVKAITVNTCSGSQATINKLKNKFDPDIETMESATFFYICGREKIPFLSVRAISNKVEPGNRDSWNISLALDNLAEKLKEILLTLE